jgi:hypothetical protein
VDFGLELQGRRIWRATPRGAFGREYYCRDDVDWPEACAAGRSFGPVAPEGHPKRLDWEAAYMGIQCPYWSAESSAHISFDPFFVSGNPPVNQNHPDNVAICGQAADHADPSWVKDPNGYVQAGIWTIATFHCTPGVACAVCASGKDGVGRTCHAFTEP